MFSFLILYLKF